MIDYRLSRFWPHRHVEGFAYCSFYNTLIDICWQRKCRHIPNNIMAIHFWWFGVHYIPLNACPRELYDIPPIPGPRYWKSPKKGNFWKWPLLSSFNFFMKLLNTRRRRVWSWTVQKCPQIGGGCGKPDRYDPPKSRSFFEKPVRRLCKIENFPYIYIYIYRSPAEL